MSRPLPKVIRLNRRRPSNTSADVRQAKIESDTDTAIAGLLEAHGPAHQAEVLRACHRLVVRGLAKIDGAEKTAVMLNVEARSLWPPLRTSVRSAAESDFAALIKRVGGVNE